MTAEVAILNKFGIAIAADSAVTIGEERVWKSTNKIYSLGPKKDIAIMIYGGGAFTGCPWEIIIKSYKEAVKLESFNKISECIDSFVSFLKSKTWGSAENERLSTAYIFVKELEEFKNSLSYKNKSEFRKQIISFLDSETEKINERNKFDETLDFDQFMAFHGKYIYKLSDDIFGEHLTKNIRDKINNYLYNFFIREKCASGDQTGLVFCGYGEEDIYPVVQEIVIDGRHKEFIRIWTNRIRDLNIDYKGSACVIAFAQRDMTSVFMEGGSDAFAAFFLSMIDGVLDRKTKQITKKWIFDSDQRKVELALQRKENREIVKSIAENFQSWKTEKFVAPLMDSIRSLPSDEMSAMAEALVELTSLRRKIDSSVQSVAGPTDVAFISKGDGLVWMKRKHYFDPHINPDFFLRRSNRYLEDHP